MASLWHLLIPYNLTEIQPITWIEGVLKQTFLNSIQPNFKNVLGIKFTKLHFQRKIIVKTSAMQAPTNLKMLSASGNSKDWTETYNSL